MKRGCKKMGIYFTHVWYRLRRVYCLWKHKHSHDIFANMANLLEELILTLINTE